jgi:hypothetical protein
MLDPPSEHGPYWAHTRSAQHTTLIAEKQTARHSWSGQPFLRHCPASYSAEEPVVLHPLFFYCKTRGLQPAKVMGARLKDRRTDDAGN